MNRRYKKRSENFYRHTPAVPSDNTKMTDVASTVLSTVSTAQQALYVLQSLLGLTSFLYPPDCTFTNGTYYDFIIVGTGTAGSVLANRLSKNGTYSVFAMDAGGDPPLESMYLGVFPALVSTYYDWNITSVNDGYTAQSVQDGVLPLTVGKMLGGSSSLNHGIMVNPPRNDFDMFWTNVIGDLSWSFDNITEYIKRTEKLVDSGLLNSSFASRYGVDGPMKLTREQHSMNQAYLEALESIGKNVGLDLSDDSFLGYVEPVLANLNGMRQSTANVYLSDALNCSNLNIAKFTTATKILINDDKVAYGVQVTTSSGDTYEIYANKEVIVSAGAILSPQLLMLSGIGPADHLESLGITTIADLPVGQNFMDHTSNLLVYQMGENTATAPPLDPFLFPTPCVCGYDTPNSTQTYPDYQAILLHFAAGSTAAVQLCSQSFKHNNSICNEFYDASTTNDMLYVVFNLMHPKSRGKILLNSTDPTVPPLVYTGAYTDSSDLTLMGQSIEHFNNILNSTYFQSLNATWMQLGYDSYEDYALGMSAGMWHGSGTCAMSKVVDPSTLYVYGVSNLRVADASVMPELVSGNIDVTVRAIAERCADFIISTYS